MLKIKELRKEKGVYQRELADILNKSITCICDWERGRTQPDIEDLKELSNFFGCTVDYLIGREGEDGTVFIMGNELSKDEEHLIDILRQLDPLSKDTVYRVAELAYDVRKEGKNK